MKQEDIWKKHTAGLTPEDLIRRIENPAHFQLELKDFIESVIKQNNLKHVIEVGCEAATTSALLNKELKITLLDLNEDIINLNKKTYKNLYPNFNYCVADMFNMPFTDESFDVVFNAGVIEHFSKNERAKAIREYYRITKKGGFMIIAFPNHYSFPYRLAYLIRYYTKRWQYPQEMKIYDLKNELEQNNITSYNRMTMSKKSVFYWSGFFKPLQKLLIFCDKLFNYEGYLTVITVRKL